MFSIPFLVAQCYPNKSLDEAQRFVDACIAQGREYYWRTWKEVTREQLLSEQVQYNLIQTLFRAQTAYTGDVEEILRSLEAWSKDSTLFFPDFPQEQSEFYQRYYCFCGFANFSSLDFQRQEYLLWSRFLTLACLWDVPVYANVQEYFAKRVYVRGMRDDANLFADAIHRNRMPLGDESRMAKSIQEWIELFDGFFGPTFTDRIPEFMANSMEVSRLSDEDKTILEKVLTLYWGLKGGFIWREIEDTVPAGFEKKEKKEGTTLEESYVELLYKTEDITPWLETHKEVAEWIATTGRSEAFVTQLLFVLLEKLDVENTAQVNLALQFFNELKDYGLENIDEVLYYDESDGKFHWDERFFYPSEKETPPSPTAQNKSLLEESPPPAPPTGSV